MTGSKAVGSAVAAVMLAALVSGAVAPVAMSDFASEVAFDVATPQPDHD